ncbi:MAG: DUF3789 domain-containing protein [Clostridia bacterium]|nr:DUF3789 domain-containing protein [Clostridia bacterium]
MFWLGLVIGSTVGVVVMCLMQVAGTTDNE